MRHASHVTLPTVIDSPGEYKTRGGMLAVITSVNLGRAVGYYKDCGIRESWDISGRTLPFTENRNDIVGRLETRG